MRHIAPVNIKKCDGRSSSSYGELKALVQDDVDGGFLVKELALLLPDVMICGSTSVFLEMVAEKYRGHGIETSWKNGAELKSRGFGFLKLEAAGDAHHILVIDAYHPSYFVIGFNLWYYYLCGIVGAAEAESPAWRRQVSNKS